MALTLLQIVEQVTNELGITEPSSVIGNTDEQVIQLKALCDRVGWDLVREHEWRRLVKENVFETTAVTTILGLVSSANTITGLTGIPASATGMVVSGTNIPDWAEVTIQAAAQITLSVSCTGTATATASCQFARQEFDLPSDFERQISGTQWSRSDRWPNMGPKSSQEWQWLKAGSITAGPRHRYRIYRNRIRISPPPTTRLVFANEYVSNEWVIAAGQAGPTKTRYSLDSDTTIFPDDVMVLGVKYQWYKTKGLDFAVPLLEFARAVSYAKAQDQDNPNLSLSQESGQFLIGGVNIPDGNW